MNIGQPRTVGSEDATDPFDRPFTSAIWKEPVQGPIWLDATGLHGDRVADTKHHGGPYRAALMYSGDHYPRWRSEWNRKDIGPGGFGENLTVRGVVEATVCLGDVFEVGEALVAVTSPRTPCHILARRHGRRDLVETVRANHRHGWYLRVLRPGWIEAGQPVALRERPYPQWPIDRVAEVKWNRKQCPEEAALLAQCPALIPNWKAALREGGGVRVEG
ncbi:MAG TPA: MOSC domain-containing protein [Gemmatimonadales bacterium]